MLNLKNQQLEETCSQCKKKGLKFKLEQVAKQDTIKCSYCGALLKLVDSNSKARILLQKEQELTTAYYNLFKR